MPASLLRLPAPPSAEATAWSAFVASFEPNADVDGLAGGFARDGMMVVRGAIPRPAIDRLQRRIAQLVIARHRHAPGRLSPLSLTPFGPHRTDVDRALAALALDDAAHLPWLARRIAALPEAIALLACDDVSAAVRRCLRLPADQPLGLSAVTIDLCAPHAPAIDDDLPVARLPSTAGPSPAPFGRLRVAIYDCPVEAGAERFRPGTHRADPSRGRASDEDRPELQHDLCEGDLVLADPRVLLRAGKNRSDRARCLLTADCGDALATW